MRINPTFEAQLEAIAEAYWHPATERPTRCAIPTTTSTEAQLIRRAAEPWQRQVEAMRRHEARRAPARRALAAFLIAFLIDLAAGAFVCFWISGGAPWR
jgi:hypothetical protein